MSDTPPIKVKSVESLVKALTVCEFIEIRCFKSGESLGRFRLTECQYTAPPSLLTPGLITITADYFP